VIVLTKKSVIFFTPGKTKGRGFLRQDHELPLNIGWMPDAIAYCIRL